MKVAVITLPLHTNYGGLLQAYALKSVLESSGHDVTVLDRKVKMPLPVWYKAPFVYAFRGLKKLFKPSSGMEVLRELHFRKELPVMGRHTSRFIESYISPKIVSSYKDIREGEYDAFVVGSDQVWRPRYFGKIEDAFLQFARGWDVKRLSYAASFGTEQLEYDYTTLEVCSELLEQFDAVSVREDVGIRMCQEWFDCDSAVQVLDPVMLLDVSRYRELAATSDRHSCKGKIMTYILDPSKEKSAVVDLMVKASGKDAFSTYIDVRDRQLAVHQRIVPPVEQWLAGFCDADFVVTDSFHGCVLSILLHKPFLAVGNSLRGMARMNSLLSMFGLDERLVQGIDPEDDGKYWLAEPDWNEVDKILLQQREKSLGFLNGVLKKEGNNG